MHDQYFCDIVDHGIDDSYQMAFLVEEGHDALHSSSDQTARENLTGRLGTEVAKLRLEKATKKKKGAAKLALPIAINDPCEPFCHEVFEGFPFMAEQLFEGRCMSSNL